MRYEKYFLEKMPYIIFIVYRYSVLLSANMKNAILVFYWYWPTRKLSLSGFISIGRYEKKLIGRTLLRRDQRTSSMLSEKLKGHGRSQLERILDTVYLIDWSHDIHIPQIFQNFKVSGGIYVAFKGNNRTREI